MGPALCLALLAAMAAAQQSAPGGPKFRGRVLDARGSPLAGVAVALKDHPRSVLARTAADGGFEVEGQLVPPMRHLVIAEGQSICTAVGAVSGLCGVTGEHLIVGAPARILAGRVVDAEGHPIAGAELTAIVEPRRMLLGFPRRLDSDTLIAPRAKSDLSGRFAFEVPVVEGLTLAARSDGCASVRTSIPSRSSGPLQHVDVTLRRTAAPWRCAGTLFGKVVRLDGTPAAGARVILGREETLADDAGRFSLEMLRGFGPGDALCAVLQGETPFLSFDPANELASFGTLDAPVVLTLGGPSQSITGHVFDQFGDPCSGWLVELADATAISRSSAPSLRVEHLSGGRPAELPVRTDVTGAFRIDGLLRRTYVLQAEPEWFAGAVMVRSEPIEAGASNVELRLEREPWIQPFRALVIDLDGVPASNARIALYLEDSLSWPTSSVADGLEKATTDTEGRFELPSVPRTSSYFIAAGSRVPIAACAHTERGWVLRIAREPNLRLDWERDAPPPIELEALDVGGGMLWIHTFVAGAQDACTSSVKLHGVRSHLLAVERSLTALQMRFSDGSIETLPVQLEPSGLTQLTID